MQKKGWLLLKWAFVSTDGRAFHHHHGNERERQQCQQNRAWVGSFINFGISVKSDNICHRKSRQVLSECGSTTETRRSLIDPDFNI